MDKLSLQDPLFARCIRNDFSLLTAKAKVEIDKLLAHELGETLASISTWVGIPADRDRRIWFVVTDF